MSTFDDVERAHTIIAALHSLSAATVCPDRSERADANRTAGIPCRCGASHPRGHYGTLGDGSLPDRGPGTCYPLDPSGWNGSRKVPAAPSDPLPGQVLPAVIVRPGERRPTYGELADLVFAARAVRDSRRADTPRALWVALRDALAPFDPTPLGWEGPEPGPEQAAPALQDLQDASDAARWVLASFGYPRTAHALETAVAAVAAVVPKRTDADAHA